MHDNDGEGYDGGVFIAKNDSSKGKPGIRWEFVVALLTVAMIVFIVFSGVWYLSTFGSMRNFTNGVYSKTDDWEGVNEQYNKMTAAFNAGGTGFEYHIAGINVTVNKITSGPATKDDYLNLVLDGYTAGLYDRTDLTGVKGAIHAVAGKSTHDIYTIFTILAAVYVLAMLYYALKNTSSLVDFLKQVGASALISGIISFVGMIVIYTLLVNTWIQTDTRIYKEGLPIIAQMIKEWYTVYLAVIIVVGILLMVPAVIQLFTKGKEDKGKAAPK